MRDVLIVPDKFKGSLSAKEVADSLEAALRRFCVGGESLNIVKLPMADGGDGSLEVVESALGEAVKRVEFDTMDALMRPLKAPVLIFGKTAFIEMAKVCGLAMLEPQERNPEKTTTYGLGLLMRRVVEAGCERIVMGIGGSSTDDGGEGLLEAYGDSSVEILVACDVDNPLLGPNGATMIYAPQKGADEAMLERLERCMEERAKRLGLDTTVPGGGAAGGVGAALHKLGAQLLPGWQVFGDMVHLEEQIAAADTIITGEGRFDGQSLSGKLIDGVVRISKKYKKKPVVVCGQSLLKPEVWKKAGVGDVYALTEVEKDTEICIREAAALLRGDGVTIIGCDEAGRGPLAGPVYGGAAVLPDVFEAPSLNDSKQLSQTQRDNLRPLIENDTIWGVGSVDAAEIDRINILNAAIKSVHLALDELYNSGKADTIRRPMVLMDGNKFKPYGDIPCHTVVKGDATIKAIAAASVLAKTHRDEYMLTLAAECPQYGWERNMAYPTEEHRDAIRRYGITKYHRKSFNLLPDDNKLF
jgi:Glycerate kinase